MTLTWWRMISLVVIIVVVIIVVIVVIVVVVSLHLCFHQRVLDEERPSPRGGRCASVPDCPGGEVC